MPSAPPAKAAASPAPAPAPVTAHVSAPVPAPVTVLFLGALALLLLLCGFMPRLLAYLPGLLGLGFYAAYLWTTRATPTLPRALWGGVAALIALAGLSALWSADPAHALERTGKIIAVLVPGLLLTAFTLRLRRPQDHDIFMWPVYAAALCGFVLSIEMLLDFPFFYNVYAVDKPPEFARTDGSYLNRGVVFLTLAAPLLAAAVWLRRSKSGALALAAGLLPCIMLSASQSSQLALVIIALCIAMPVRRRLLWPVLFAATAALILCAPLLAQWMFATLAEPFSVFAFTAAGGGYAPQRLEIWDGLARLIIAQPLFGYGIEAVRHIETLNTGLVYIEEDHTLHPHNFALQFWIEFGAIGALLIIGLCGLVLRYLALHRFNPAVRFVLAAFAATLSAGAMSYGIWQGWWLGMMTFLLAYAALVLRAGAAEIPPRRPPESASL